MVTYKFQVSNKKYTTLTSFYYTILITIYNKIAFVKHLMVNNQNVTKIRLDYKKVYIKK